ncbi:hypothetical protein PFISCL1PPCAC_28105, partial [Pristionchus fissidentatus]
EFSNRMNRIVLLTLTLSSLAAAQNVHRVSQEDIDMDPFVSPQEARAHFSSGSSERRRDNTNSFDSDEARRRRVILMNPGQFPPQFPPQFPSQFPPQFPPQ